MSLIAEIALALRDWITLAALRDMCSKKEQENASNAEMNRGTDEGMYPVIYLFSNTHIFSNES